jgi:hypothetical protein
MVGVKVHRNFLSEIECNNIKRFVTENKDKWLEYKDAGSDSSISVFGNSYFRHLLSSGFNVSSATEKYRRGNSVSNDAFYDMMLKRFSEVFGNCSYMKNMGKPGFQIITQNTPRIWHYDDEKLRYPYGIEFSDYTDFSYFDRVFTFTIMLSDGNFTYDYYTETSSYYSDPAMYYCKNHHGLIGDDCGQCDLKEYKTIKYSIGDLVLTEDRYLHRVGVSDYNKDERITIQGHIVSKNNMFYLYW